MRMQINKSDHNTRLRKKSVLACSCIYHCLLTGLYSYFEVKSSECACTFKLKQTDYEKTPMQYAEFLLVRKMKIFTGKKKNDIFLIVPDRIYIYVETKVSSVTLG